MSVRSHVAAVGRRPPQGEPRSRNARQHLRELTLSSLKRYVEQHLSSPDLCAAMICAQSGWSRATVYRLFKGEGGVLGYVQRRRLQRAFRELAALGPHRRILDIALECQFASESTFNRAFRRTFGLPPGAARSLLQQACRGSTIDRGRIVQEPLQVVLP